MMEAYQPVGPVPPPIPPWWLDVWDWWDGYYDEPAPRAPGWWEDE